MMMREWQRGFDKDPSEQEEKDIKKRIIVGASGASGQPILIEVLKLLRQTEGVESQLIMTDSAKKTLLQETDYSLSEVEALADVVLDAADIGAGPASGSYRTAGMIVVPCSMKTVAGICSGYTDNLLLRAADVTIKEQRLLVLAARESPLSVIHLRNLSTLAAIPGVRIMPPMLTYYHRPKTIEEMTYHIAAKLVEPFGIEAKEYRRWSGMADAEMQGSQVEQSRR